MKKIILVCSVLLSIAITSCNKEENSNLEGADTSLNVLEEKREPGQIPKSINFLGDINALNGNIHAHVELLRNYKLDHNGYDYYNNLFEISSNRLFTNENFNELEVSDLSFLLDEMRSLESNMVNIIYFPKLLNALLDDHQAISEEQFFSIAKELIDKNRAELSALDWDDLDDEKDEKFQELDKVHLNLFYPRIRYRGL